LTAAPLTSAPAPLHVISGEYYAASGYPFREWAWLRRHEPVAWIEHPDYDPFWAITKHADIIELSKQPHLFHNGPRLAVFSNLLPPPPEARSGTCSTWTRRTTASTATSPASSSRRGW
jgi:hypothetical protein